MTNEVLVTVIVPAYNHEKYIIECLESIHNQTYRDFQWIVVDDGSKDSTPQILKDNKDKYGYELIIQENKGLSKTLTDTIVNYAKGRYISICASDDYWCVDKLEKQVRYMEAHKECAMCYGKAFEMDIHSQLLKKQGEYDFEGGNIFNQIITIKFHPPVNYMYRKSVLQEFGYFKSGVIAEDFYMNCLISSKYNIGYIPDYLSYYRVAPVETKRDPYVLLKSHEDTISLFRDNPIFQMAFGLHCVRCFLLLALYSKYKLLSLRYLYRGFEYASPKDVLRGFYYLIRYRKKC